MQPVSLLVSQGNLTVLCSLWEALSSLRNEARSLPLRPDTGMDTSHFNRKSFWRLKAMSKVGLAGWMGLKLIEEICQGVWMRSASACVRACCWQRAHCVLQDCQLSVFLLMSFWQKNVLLNRPIYCLYLARFTKHLWENSFKNINFGY